jgi:two-component system, response regulator PdtaR
MFNSLKILVVEDEAITAMELQKKLISWGYDVVDMVSSGENAIKKALELKPDLILMDILLKGSMTGVDAAREIKNLVDIPIIYLTAYCNDETFEGAKITQPYAYLIKPFQENELKFAIEMAFYGHQSQLKLKESEAHYRILAESTTDMIFIINKDLLVDYVNESSLKYLKQPKEEIIGKPLKQIFPENVFEFQKKTLVEIFRTKKSLCSEDLMVFPEEELWVSTCFKPLKDQNGQIYAIMGISRDISQYKRIQEEFQGQDNLDLDLIENITHPIFYKDKLGLYLACNRAFQDLVGLTKEEIIGKTVYDIAPTKMADRYLEMDQELFENPGTQYYDFQVQHADGSIRDILFNKITITDSKGNLKGILGLMIDITSRKTIETKIQKSMEEKDVLIRDIHEGVKNNFNMISNLLSLQSDSINDNKIRRMFSESEKRARALALVYEKLSYSNDLTSVEFGDYLKNLGKMLIDFDTSKRELIDYQVISDEIFLGIDSVIPLALIANELVSNSLKHAFSYDAKGILKVQMEQEYSYLIMRISDNGLGMPDDFNFRESENIGFKIVKNLLDDINGEIEFKNEQGTDFIIKVPKKSLTVK